MIRDAVPADAAAVAAIYAHHVLHGTASFDTEPPSVEATAEKIVWVAERGWAWLVAEEGGAVVGYVYFTQFRDRPAYRWCAEDSIYVRADAQGRGVGRALLGSLLARAEDVGFRQICAVVGGGEPASVALHERFGFAEVGRTRAVGWKHGRWLDAVYMQRALGTGERSMPEEIT